MKKRNDDALPSGGAGAEVGGEGKATGDVGKGGRRLPPA
jgi:hypothetical protein